MVVVPMAHAAGNRLLIDDLDVEVGDRWSRNVDDGDRITREAAPGDTVEFKITFKNNYTEEEDLRIEDITATVTIEGIDDDEDLDEESKEFDVKEDDDKTVSVEFEIPIEVEEDTYTVTIEAEGEDENGTDHTVEWTVDLEVEKETHELRFYRKTLSPTETECGGIVTLNLGIINTGSEDEEDIELVISNTELEYNNVVTISELEAEPYEDESKYLKRFTINVPKTAEVGIYLINFKVTYDDGDEVIEDSVELTVSECEEEEEPECVEDSDCEEGEVCEDGVCEEEEEEVVVVTEPTIPTAAVITEPTTITEPITVTEEEEKSFFETGWFIGLLFGAEIIVIIIAVLLVMALVRRKAG